MKTADIERLASQLKGKIHVEEAYCALYGQDASVYRQIPDAVAVPYDEDDLVAIVKFANRHHMPLIPRGGGTSLAGQAVGKGIVLDLSRHFNRISAIDTGRREATVQAGVVRDHLNDTLRAHGLLFAPEASTSNRCVIGGMVGNNACGTRSIYYGATADHVIAIRGVLSDGSRFFFAPTDEAARRKKEAEPSLEGRIYQRVSALIDRHKTTIADNAPDATLIRHNSGYALDRMLRNQPWQASGQPFNLAHLLCGSEGSLAIISEITVRLVQPPPFQALLCPHFDSVDSAFACLPGVIASKPAAVELFDKATLECMLERSESKERTAWIKGCPEALYAVEVYANSERQLGEKTSAIRRLLRRAYHCPELDRSQQASVWRARKEALGYLINHSRRRKALAVIEDAAVPVRHLGDYYRKINRFCQRKRINLIVYGHASAGVLHLRPELDLHDESDRRHFEVIARYSAALVKDYRGSLSGEHGDGRLRSVFLKPFYGNGYYQLLEEVKDIFDPGNVLNPGVITQARTLMSDIRKPVDARLDGSTLFDWRRENGLSGAIERCSGLGVCRKSTGIMCPSYQVTGEESLSTRGRSALIRYAMAQRDPAKGLSLPLLKRSLDLCLGCKGCKSECPASVDMARIKAEVLHICRSQQTAKERRQAALIRKFPWLLKALSLMPEAIGRLQNRPLVKKIAGVDTNRSLPVVQKNSFQRWWQKHALHYQQSDRRVGLVVDLFHNYYEPHIGIACAQVVRRLGYALQPIFLKHSPRLLVSAGLLGEAKDQLLRLQEQISHHPRADWIGIEPAEVLLLRDDGRALVGDIFPPVQLLDEWLPQKLGTDSLTPTPGVALLHVHCHQRVLSKSQLALGSCIPGLETKTTTAGCCGMSGQFGYRHYKVSRAIAERGILQDVRSLSPEAIVMAAGSSCRQQLRDLSQCNPIHPVELIARCLR